MPAWRDHVRGTEPILTLSAPHTHTHTQMRLARQGAAVARAHAAPSTLLLCMQSQQAPNESQLGPGASSEQANFLKRRQESEKAIFLRQLLQAHPLNGQTALHAAAFQGRQEVVDMLLDHGARKDSRFFLQAGDGLGEREREFFFGERARDALFFVASAPSRRRRRH